MNWVGVDKDLAVGGSFQTDDIKKLVLSGIKCVIDTRMEFDFNAAEARRIALQSVKI